MGSEDKRTEIRRDREKGGMGGEREGEKNACRKGNREKRDKESQIQAVRQTAYAMHDLVHVALGSDAIGENECGDKLI